MVIVSFALIFNFLDDSFSSSCYQQRIANLSKILDILILNIGEEVQIFIVILMVHYKKIKPFTNTNVSTTMLTSNKEWSHQPLEKNCHNKKLKIEELATMQDLAICEIRSNEKIRKTILRPWFMSY